MVFCVYHKLLRVNRLTTTTIHEQKRKKNESWSKKSHDFDLFLMFFLLFHSITSFWLFGVDADALCKQNVHLFSLINVRVLCTMCFRFVLGFSHSKRSSRASIFWFNISCWKTLSYFFPSKCLYCRSVKKRWRKNRQQMHTHTHSYMLIFFRSSFYS